jgi:hypothetical protein
VTEWSIIISIYALPIYIPHFCLFHDRIVEEFECLGRIVMKHDKDEPAVMRNLARARAKWASMRRFLVRDAADPKTMATFYRTVVLHLCATLWQRMLGTADKRFDETTSEFS